MTIDEAYNQQKKLRRILYSITALVAAPVGTYVVWLLRSLILPFIIGTLAAFICAPILSFAKRKGIPRGIGIFILFAFFFLTIFLIVTQISKILPDERDKLVLKTRLHYKIHEKYRNLMGLNSPEATGNIINTFIGKDIYNAIQTLDKFILLNSHEQALFIQYSRGYNDKPPIPEKYYQYFEENLKDINNKELKSVIVTEENLKTASTDDDQKESVLSAMIEVIELWILMPFVFLFLLIDDGEIKKYFVSMIPNRYFEVSLTVINNVNNAIGNYLRGTLFECSLVGLSLIVLFSIIGFEIKWALIIGIIAGIVNAIPLLGPVFALVLGFFYALITEDVVSILPFMNANNLFIGVIVCVVFVRILDDAVFQPFVIGSAVHLHPLVVIIGLIGGSILFGFAGLLLTVPLIVVLKEFSSTLFRELKAYNII
jgi:predicted PurR-regulated permease PerM